MRRLVWWAMPNSPFLPELGRSCLPSCVVLQDLAQAQQEAVQIVRASACEAPERGRKVRTETLKQVNGSTFWRLETNNHPSSISFSLCFYKATVLKEKMASQLTSYLPPAEGLLPKWLLFVCNLLVTSPFMLLT